MIDHPVKCRGDLTVEGCIIRLQEYRVSSLMVVDKAGRLIGVVDKSVLIKRPKPDAQADAVMRPVRFSVHPEDQLIDIVKAMVAGESFDAVGGSMMRFRCEDFPGKVRLDGMDLFVG